MKLRLGYVQAVSMKGEIDLKKLLFAVLFIIVVFFGFRYLQGKLTVPISEINMNSEQEEKYLEELNEISGEGLQDTTMTTLKQCFEMANAYNTYACIGNMINDESFMSSKGMDDDVKGKALYDLFSNQKPIIEMNFNRLDGSDDAKGIYAVSFMLLQESKQPIYFFHVKDTVIEKVMKGDS